MCVIVNDTFKPEKREQLTSQLTTDGFWGPIHYS